MTFKSILLSSLLFTSITYATDTHTIAHIPEASGISYCDTTQSLIVANDEGAFYELDVSGSIIKQHTLGKYDLEGVVCNEHHIVFAVEGGALLIVDRHTLKTKTFRLKGKGFKLSKKAGIEGLAYFNDLYYLSIQAKKKKDAKILIVKIGKNYAKVIDIIEHGIIDAAGLHYYNQKLYIVSDKKDKLYTYDLKQDKITQKIKLDKFAQEGIAFDDKKNIYFADDDGSVKKYTMKELGLKKL
jgi:uncharacterized protein YjiK